jgi:catechol 2,3-dioxygenase-like lactoylglutathione lyase family enzyme
VAEVPGQEESTVRITLVSIHVEDQDRALAFYRDVLGFVPKVDIPMGAYRWLTVVAPDALDGPELVLEPNAHPAARAYQDALLRDGIPVTSFEVDDVDAEHRRLRGKGLPFTRPPADAGPVRVAVFADTCGNVVQIHARRSAS